MRIIAGKHKGRKLEVPKHELRPTKDFTREALFNIIDVKDKSFLDLFAGSGSVGIEAISRYCKNAMFVDDSRESVATIKKNLKTINEEGTIINNSVISFLEKNQDLREFDLIYFDPPYKTDLGIETLIYLDKNTTLNDNIKVIYEHSSLDKNKIDNLFDDLVLKKLVLEKTKKYGKSSLSFFVIKIN